MQMLIIKSKHDPPGHTLLETLLVLFIISSLFIFPFVSISSWQTRLAAYQFFDQPQKVALEIREGLREDQMQNVRVADSQESCLADLAVISSKFLIPYRGVGILAIIGPVNLDYQQLINQVNVVNRVLTMKLTDFYRYLSSNHYEVH